MRLLPPVVIAAAFALGSCASDDGNVTGQSASGGKQPSPGKTIPVEIVVGSKPDLDKACAGGTPATTVFVDNVKQVYHCVKNVLMNHDEHDKGNPAMAATIVHASTGDQIRWYSKTHDFTVNVVKHPKLGPQHPDAPDFPFGRSMLASSAREQVSPAVPAALKGKIQQRYKVSFNIAGVGLVDPDLICTMF